MFHEPFAIVLFSAPVVTLEVSVFGYAKSLFVCGSSVLALAEVFINPIDEGVWVLFSLPGIFEYPSLVFVLIDVFKKPYPRVGILGVFPDVDEHYFVKWRSIYRAPTMSERMVRNNMDGDSMVDELYMFSMGFSVNRRSNSGSGFSGPKSDGKKLK